MRIWFQKHTVAGRNPLLDAMYAEHMAAVAAPDTVIDIHTLPDDTYRSDLPEHLVGFPQVRALFDGYFAATAVEAEREGCHAWISGAGQDPGLGAARAQVAIPVTGYGETIWQLAHAVGCRLGVLGFIPGLREPISANIHRVGAHLAAYPVIEDGADIVQRALGGQEGPFVDAYTAAAHRAADAGAQVLVPAEGIPNELLVHLNIRALAGLPVADPGGLAVATAEHLSRVRERGFWRYPPRCPTPPDGVLDHLQRVLTSNLIGDLS